MRREWWATAVFFGTNGAAYGTIFPRLPEIVERYDLTPAGLGLVLFVPVLASLVGSALGGRVVVRFGARASARVSVAMLALSLSLAVVTPFVAALVAAFALLGLVDGTMDVAMNMHAVDLENRITRPVLQGLHAAWTGGAVLAAAAAGIVAGTVSLGTHLAGAAAALGVVGLVLPSWWEPVRTPVGEPGDGSFGALRTLFFVAVGVAFVESIPIDWASVFSTEVFGAEPRLAAGATTTALTGMFLGRLAGDRVVHRFGARRAVIGFAVLSAIGGVFLTVAPTAATGYGALFVAGMGSSVMFPAIVSIAGRITDGGIATVTAASRLGFMAAPVITGAVADRLGFRPIMLMPAAIALAVAAWARSSARISPGRPVS